MLSVSIRYKDQKFHLEQAFRRKYDESIANRVDFNTVDGFQGQEKDIIILSCVRAGPDVQSIGFLGDRRRMNVALTRAKSGLFILGSASTLERGDETWALIIADARRRGMLTKVRKSNRESMRCLTFDRSTLDTSTSHRM